MNYLNLIRGTVLKMNQATFAQWKDALVGQYIVFSVIAPEEIDQEIMAEKLCDYFEKAELKNGKSFEKFVEVYLSLWFVETTSGLKHFRKWPLMALPMAKSKPW